MLYISFTHNFQRACPFCSQIVTCGIILGHVWLSLVRNRIETQWRRGLWAWASSSSCLCTQPILTDQRPKSISKGELIQAPRILLSEITSTFPTSVCEILKELNLIPFVSQADEKINLGTILIFLSIFVFFKLSSYSSTDCTDPVIAADSISPTFRSCLLLLFSAGERECLSITHSRQEPHQVLTPAVQHRESWDSRLELSSYPQPFNHLFDFLCISI